MATEYIDCVLESGFFEDELYVIVGDSSAIVSRSNVRVTREPNDEYDGAGELRVYIVEINSDRVLVEIPGQAVVGSLRTWVTNQHASVTA